MLHVLIFLAALLLPLFWPLVCGYRMQMLSNGFQSENLSVEANLSKPEHASTLEGIINETRQNNRTGIVQNDLDNQSNAFAMIESFVNSTSIVEASDATDISSIRKRNRGATRGIALFAHGSPSIAWPKWFPNKPPNLPDEASFQVALDSLLSSISPSSSAWIFVTLFAYLAARPVEEDVPLPKGKIIAQIDELMNIHVVEQETGEPIAQLTFWNSDQKNPAVHLGFYIQLRAPWLQSKIHEIAGASGNSTFMNNGKLFETTDMSAVLIRKIRTEPKGLVPIHRPDCGHISMIVWFAGRVFFIDSAGVQSYPPPAEFLQELVGHKFKLHYNAYEKATKSGRPESVGLQADPASCPVFAWTDFQFFFENLIQKDSPSMESLGIQEMSTPGDGTQPDPKVTDRWVTKLFKVQATPVRFKHHFAGVTGDLRQIGYVSDLKFQWINTQWLQEMEVRKQHLQEAGVFGRVPKVQYDNIYFWYLFARSPTPTNFAKLYFEISKKPVNTRAQQIAARELLRYLQ